MNVDHPFNYISLFSGGGGLDLGFHLAVRNARCVAYVEREAFAIACLEARMAEGSLAPAPIHTDVTQFSGLRFRGLVGGVIGGSPCQDMSLAGARRGLGGDKSILFYEQTRIIEESQPAWLLWENVLGAKKWLPAIFAEFERIGYAGKGTVIRASDVGAPHQRARIFVLARRVADTEGRGESDLPRGTDSQGPLVGVWAGAGGGVVDGSSPAGVRESGRIERGRSVDVCDSDFQGVADTESLRLRSESNGGGGAASDSGAPVRGGDVAHSAGARLSNSEDSGTDRRDARTYGSGGLESERAGLDLAHAERAGRIGYGGRGPSEAGGGGSLGEVEGPGLGLADAESFGRIERRTESDSEREARTDDAGETDAWREHAARFFGDLRAMANASCTEERIESGRSSGSSRADSTVAGFVGEDVADDDDERRENERGAGLFLRGAPRGDDADGCGDQELVDAEGQRAPATEQCECGGGALEADEELADAGDARLQVPERSRASGEGAGASRPATECGHPEWPPGPDGDWSRIDPRYFPAQSRVRRVAHGLAGGLDPAVVAQDVWADRLRMLGNGVVPKQAAAAIRFLYAAITRSTTGA